jgi:hypothetical protein
MQLPSCLRFFLFGLTLEVKELRKILKVVKVKVHDSFSFDCRLYLALLRATELNLERRCYAGKSRNSQFH